MGTDIHFYVERREAGKWLSCDIWEKSEYEDDGITVPYGKHFYDGRNYNTFAILANVRNGRGFAGCDTGDGFVPIAEPRGLPDDMSPELSKEAEGVDHTPSWLTLKELMDYDWTQVSTLRGVINGPEFERWTAYNRAKGLGPDSWSGAVMGGNVRHISEDEMAAQVQSIKDTYKDRRDYWREDFQKEVKTRLGSTYCQVSWQIPCYRAASQFVGETLPRLWRLGAPEDVRAVFWFDS